MATGASAASPSKNPLRRALGVLTDLRVLQALGQIIFMIILVFVVVQLWNNIVTALDENNITPNFDFMQNRAGFEIGGAEGYTPDDSYWEAFLVGLRNSLSIIVVGLFSTTILGILGGIFLLSSNWLVRSISRGAVEFLRNIPLLVFIYLMYFVVILSLPPLRDSLTFPNEGILVIRYRWFAYVIAAIALSFSLRKSAWGMRRLGWSFLIGAIITLELLIRYAAQPPAFMNSILSIFPGSQTAASGAVILSTVGMILLVGLIIAALIGLAHAFKPAQTVLTGAALGFALGAICYQFAILPSDGIRIETIPVIYLNNRGLTYPEVLTTIRFAEWGAFIALGIGFGAALYVYLRRLTITTGKPYPRLLWALFVLFAFTIIGWFIVSGEPAPQNALVTVDGTVTSMPVQQALDEDLITQQQALLYASTPLEVILPQRQGLRFGTGETISPEYMALLLALVIYTAAFIAEIVRAGILAVPRGQLEAARALGLSYPQLLRMVILPQALRVIIPPLTNQYLNLAKNSSLAIAISFADIYQVMNTVGNQSGQSVAAITLIMITYLIISLIIAAIMNIVNARYQLVTR
jgi:His/Glu/Gln/Arg/opine family amino acid ABC transporter permease subunit